MTEDGATSFVTYYLRSLAERTRAEKAGLKFGFDWVIYNLALADNLTPYRLPFVRSGGDAISKTKTEPEFGIDFSFLSQDRQTLTIFVLKDEILCNQTWTAHGFDGDLRRAAAPDLHHPEFTDVRNVRIILAYNKDEDQTGIQLFENLVNSLPKTLDGNVTLSFVRWNLTILAEKVRLQLLTPSLLPQKFFSLFSYICSQFGDIRHGSDAWEKQLVPNWRRFLDDLLKDGVDERTARLVPVALIILREHGKDNTTCENGWIDLTEWAMLSLWASAMKVEDQDVKEVVLHVWIWLYLAELGRFYETHAKELSCEHCIGGGGTFIDAVADSVIAYWHLGRMGLLSSGYSEVLPKSEGKIDRCAVALQKVANIVAGFIMGNPAAMRPLLDIHHIELYLVWRALWCVGRKADIHAWLINLGQRLLVRRFGLTAIPFIEGGNSLDLVFESVAMGKTEPEFCDRSSALILVLLELSFSLDVAQRDEVLGMFYNQIVLGRDSAGIQMENVEPLDLMSWAPPDHWANDVLAKSLADDGVSQVLDVLQPPCDAPAIVQHIESFVKQSRAVGPVAFPDNMPVSVILLACLKNRSPLPPELWRRSIFGGVDVQGGGKWEKGASQRDSSAVTGGDNGS